MRHAKYQAMSKKEEKKGERERERERKGGILILLTSNYKEKRRIAYWQFKAKTSVASENPFSWISQPPAISGHIRRNSSHFLCIRATTKKNPSFTRAYLPYTRPVIAKRMASTDISPLTSLPIMFCLHLVEYKFNISDVLFFDKTLNSTSNALWSIMPPYLNTSET